MTMQNYYRFNVSKDGKHFFATAEGSITDERRAREVGMELAKRFPESEGFKVTCSYWQAYGQQFPFDVLVWKATTTEIVAALNLHPHSTRLFDSCSGATEYRNSSDEQIVEFHCVTSSGEHVELTTGRVAEALYYRKNAAPLPLVADSRINVEFNGDDTFTFRLVLL